MEGPVSRGAPGAWGCMRMEEPICLFVRGILGEFSLPRAVRYCFEWREEALPGGSSLCLRLHAPSREGGTLSGGAALTARDFSLIVQKFLMFSLPKRK